MSLKEFQKAFDRLPAKSKARFLRSNIDREISRQSREVEQKLEDYFDIKRHLEALDEREFVPWENLKKKLDAKFNRLRKTSRKLS